MDRKMKHIRFEKNLSFYYLRNYLKDAITNVRILKRLLESTSQLLKLVNNKKIINNNTISKKRIKNIIRLS